MRFAAILLLPAVCFCGDPDLVKLWRLENIHAQRIERAKSRVVSPAPGVYQDFRAVSTEYATDAIIADAKLAGAQILVSEHGPFGIRDGVLVTHGQRLVTVTVDGPEFLKPRQQRRLLAAFRLYPEEVFAIAGEQNLGRHEDVKFRVESTHYLASGLTEQAIRSAIAGQRDYQTYDWLCDPSGFYFIAENNLGAFDIGDSVPMLAGTRLLINLPVAAHIRVFRNGGSPIAEAYESHFTYTVSQPGDYKAGASLDSGRGEETWVTSSAIHIVKPPALDVPVVRISDSVEVHRAIPYSDDGIDKHKLDLFLPRGKTNFPVMVFFHGGAWQSGDRSTYGPLGYRMAKAGIGVAIASYRLMPRNPHPAQIEDAAAAFAWVYKNIAQYGGDVSRLYLAGHSAGGHLAALLALDGDYLNKAGIPASAIHGVATISGIYDVGTMKEFQNADDDPSPIHHVHTNAPPFLITYCQWDYLGLPKQARDFAAALKTKFVSSRLVYVPGQSHVSEIMNTVKDDDITARALIDFIR